MADEWGPWIEHDGKGCQCVGMWVRAVFERMPGTFTEFEGIAGATGGLSWDWSQYLKLAPDGSRVARIIRYRIRKPRALLDLI